MKALFINGVAVAAPGMHTWEDAQSILSGETSYVSTALPPASSTLLPANEQRRATITVRLAFRVAEAAIKHASADASALATVFASSDADMMVSHKICSALATAQRLVSPTDFHNSVHNAPSGYWHIGAHSRRPSSAIAGYDYSFAIGLIEAMTQSSIDGHDTLLVCYDAPAPEPLLERRPLTNQFAVALLLSSQRTATTLASIEIETLNEPSRSTLAASEDLEALRMGNPAARSLPLLSLLARRASGRIVLERGSERRVAFGLSV